MANGNDNGKRGKKGSNRMKFRKDNPHWFARVSKPKSRKTREAAVV